MPRVARPAFEPIPDPPGPDPATLTEFQALAAENYAGVEPALDQAGVDLATLADQSEQSAQSAEQLGLELAAGAVELAAMQAEAAADTLLPELAAAGEQDAALDGVRADLGTALGEPTTVEPAPSTPAPTPVTVPITTRPPPTGGAPPPEYAPAPTLE
jgi:hypothetical protein